MGLTMGAYSSTDKTTEVWAPSGVKIFKDTDKDTFASIPGSTSREMHAKQCDANVQNIKNALQGAIDYQKQSKNSLTNATGGALAD